MPRRGENIYKRKDGRWEARILMPEGKYRYLYAKTYKDVREKKKQQQQNMKPRKELVPKNSKNAADLFEHWMSDGLSKRIKASTYSSYYSCIRKYVIPFFSHTVNQQISELTVNQFVKSVNDNERFSLSYKRKVLSIFKTALKDILRNSTDYSTVIEAIRLPKGENATVQVFSIGEQRRLELKLLQCDDNRALGILLCFYTGIRLGELCALKWGDIDTEAGTMSVSRTVSRIKDFRNNENKTSLIVGTPKSQSSVRKIPLPVFLLKLLKAQEAYHENDNCYIFSGSNIPIDPRSFQKLFKKILNSASVKDRKFHAIRHTFATRALELGIDIKTLSDILGHSNVSITLNIYSHSLIEQKKIAIEKLNEMYIKHMEVSSFAVTNSVIPA